MPRPRQGGFVPAGFAPPTGLETERFRLEPLRPEHNERDHAAWSSSIEHIRSTPGFAESSWPAPMTLAENLADLERHARDFEAREGFTYTVLDREADVVGCVYVYPAADGLHDADVRSWVRASRAELDEPLWHAVSGWLAGREWPFRRPLYADR
jgi:hypothetical protein